MEGWNNMQWDLWKVQTDERAPFESVKRSIRKEGFFKYLQRVGMENWVLAQKHVIFRPVAWLYQLCRFAFEGVIGLIKRKKVFGKEKQIIRIEDLLDRLEKWVIVNTAI